MAPVGVTSVAVDELATPLPVPTMTARYGHILRDTARTAHGPPSHPRPARWRDSLGTHAVGTKPAGRATDPAGLPAVPATRRLMGALKTPPGVPAELAHDEAVNGAGARRGAGARGSRHRWVRGGRRRRGRLGESAALNRVAR